MAEINDAITTCSASDCLSNDLHSQELATSNFYQAYVVNGPFQGDDESLYYSFLYPNPDYSEEGEGSEKYIYSAATIEPAGGVIDENEIFVNSKTTVDGMSVWADVNVTITAPDALKNAFPYARVEVDGKDYDLSVLDSAIKFDMGELRSHYIKIRWSKEYVETFRVVANR